MKKGGGAGLKQILRRCSSLGRRQQQNGAYEHEEEENESAGLPVPSDVPRGHFAVYVGERRRRFVVPLALLDLPEFRCLLRRAEEEFGFAGAGAGTVEALMNSAEVRAALGARPASEGAAPWRLKSPVVEEALHDDEMKSAKPDVEALLAVAGASAARVRVLLYEGIRDIHDGPVTTEAWLRELQWDGLAAFQEAPRAVWRRRRSGSGGAGGGRGKLAGYVQKHGALVHVAVYGAGHVVPAAQGRAAQEMIEDWVFDKGLFGADAAA